MAMVAISHRLCRSIGRLELRNYAAERPLGVHTDG
jgi:hypothetical protein